MEQGLYGQIVGKSDAGVEGPLATQVAIYDDPVDLNEVAVATSDAAGVFAVTLPPGAYALCAAFGCVAPMIAAGETVRADLVDAQWTLSPRPGCVHN